jgi:hypothetical protein
LIAGAVLVGCAVLGIATLTKAIPASYASMPAEPAGTGTGALQSEIAGPDDGSGPVSAATLPATSRRANRAWCPECGVVESIVELVPYADLAERHMVPVNIDDDTKGAAGDRAHVAPARRFAMTVRFRDGTTTVFQESTARTWRPGVRVRVIAGGPPAAR